ncbi:MAG: hypothetical protein U0470_07340 [Anaerolineae bacterium]
MMKAAVITRAPDVLIPALAERNPMLAGRAAAQEACRASDAVKENLRWQLVATSRDPEVDLRVRIAAGLALGELGVICGHAGRGLEGHEYFAAVRRDPRRDVHDRERREHLPRGSAGASGDAGGVQDRAVSCDAGGVCVVYEGGGV